MGYGGDPYGQSGGYAPQGYGQPYAQPYAAPYGGARPSTHHGHPANRRLLIPAILVLVAGVIALVGLSQSWYQITESVSNTGVSGSVQETLNFYYNQECGSGTSTATGSATISACITYSSAAQLASLYLAVELMSILAGVFGILAFIFGLLGALGQRLFRLQFTLAFILALVAGLMLLFAPVALALGQPGAIGAASTGSSSTSGPCGSQGPQSSFFGSCTNSSTAEGSISESWMPSVSWYLSFVGFIIGLIGAVRLRDAEKDHADAIQAAQIGDLRESGGYGAGGGGYGGPGYDAAQYAQQGGYGGYAQPGGYGGYTPSPQPAPYGGYPPQTSPYAQQGAYGGGASYAQPPAAQGYAAPGGGYAPPAYNVPAALTCPNCGTLNPAGASVCGRCRQPFY